MKRILIVGDSFMRPDQNYPGEHFSEMLGQVETIVMSQDGSSMGMILNQVIQGLRQEPDAIIIGFTSPDRIEYRRSDGLSTRWIPSGAVGALTPQQAELDLLYHTQSDLYMNEIKGRAMAAGIMGMLSNLDIAFAWTANLMYGNRNSDYHHILEMIIAPYADCRTATDFSHYEKFVDRPGFHVHDSAWQKRFAQECIDILSRQVDF